MTDIASVVLTKSEMEMAALIGCQRQIECLVAGRKYGYGLDEQNTNGWEMHVEGAMAELAYCKYRKKYWSGSVNTFKSPDCGTDTEIRSSKLMNASLIVRDNDSDDSFYVLVIGTAPNFRICGWIKGCDAKIEQFKRAPNGRPPAYFVPQCELKPFTIL